MHRVDGPGHVGNLFTEGDPVGGTPATTVTADIANALQEEVANTVEGSGQTLSKPDNTQLLAAVTTLASATGAFKNLLINGDFRFWQWTGTGASDLPATLNDASVAGGNRYYADGWFLHEGDTGAGTVDRGEFTLGGSSVPGQPRYFLEWIQTTAATSGAPYLEQKIEDVLFFGGRDITVSFWAQVASGTLDLTVNVLQDFGSGGSLDVPHAQTAVTATTSWQKFSFTITLGSLSGKTIGSGDHLKVRVTTETGETYTLRIAKFRVQYGTTAEEFGELPDEIELARCQRYVEKSYPPDVAPGTAFGSDFHAIKGVWDKTWDGSPTTSVMYGLCQWFAVTKYEGATPDTILYALDGTEDEITVDGSNVASSSPQGEGVNQSGYPRVTATLLPTGTKRVQFHAFTSSLIPA